MARPITHGSQHGFSYLVVLLIAVVLGITSMATFEHFDTLAKREREQQWLFAGQQYQHAINSYYQQSPDGIKQLPAALSDLLKDPRFASTKRHLRKIYPDPITGQPWRLILNEDNRIMGVVSSSDATVLQRAKIEAQIANLTQNEADATYADFQFVLDKARLAEGVTEEVQQQNTVVPDTGTQFSDNN